MPENALCCIALFARLPVAGKVKTRLIPALGAAGACRLHTLLLENSLHLLNSLTTCDTCLWLDTPGDHPVLHEYGGAVHIQQGTDLGERLQHAAASLLVNYKSVIFIGTDCPALDARYLLQAEHILQNNAEVVIGPAIDGGYVLLGTRSCLPGLFSDIDWGTEKVLAQTLAAVRTAQQQVVLLPEMADIDRPEDLHMLEQFGLSAALTRNN
jgi:rSAM/selenodomain-associated transferase 1